MNSPNDKNGAREVLTTPCHRCGSAQQPHTRVDCDRWLELMALWREKRDKHKR